MVRWFAVFLCFAVCLVDARKKDKPPDIEILEARARRQENTIRIDGRVRNTGEKPISGLELQFNFMDSDHVLLTEQKASIEQEVLDLGREAGFHVQVNDVARAVEFQIEAADETGRLLRIGKPGPFNIE